MWHNQSWSCSPQRIVPVLDTAVAPLLFLSHFRHWEGKDTEDRMGPEVSQMLHFYSISPSNATGILLGIQTLCTSRCLSECVWGHPLMNPWLWIKFRGHARNGSRTASSDFVLYHIRLQVLYSLAFPGYFYCPRDWKQKNILSLGWRICPYLFQLNLTLVEFSTSSF